MKQVFNPYLPSFEYIPDGEPYVFDGRVYVYGSHDCFGVESFCVNDYVTWSAPVDDLTDWRYEGVIFRREQDPLNKEGKYPLFAPDVEKGKDGKYYLFYAPAGTRSIGVAVCDTPCGQFEFVGHVTHENGKLAGQSPDDGRAFDPAAFIDDDGKIYVYYGFSPFYQPKYLAPDERFLKGPFVAELDEDMHSLKGEAKFIEITGIPDEIRDGLPPFGAPLDDGKPVLAHEFFEASSMRKINGKYYFIYSSRNSHELCYAIGDSPLGPFAYGGVLHSNCDVGLVKNDDRTNDCGNNHGSLVCIKGQWYVFGHRQTNYTMYARQGVAEPVTIAEDGSIAQAEMTSCGLNGGPLCEKGEYPAYIACGLKSAGGARFIPLATTGEEADALRDRRPALTQDGKDRECDPDQHIANLYFGDAATFKYFDFDKAATFSVVTRGAKGKFVIRHAADGKVIGEVAFAASESWTASEKAAFAPEKGKQALVLTYEGEGPCDLASFTME